MFEETKKSWLLPLFQKRNMNPTLLIQNVQKLFDDEERQRRLQGRFYYLRSILDDFYDYDQVDFEDCCLKRYKIYNLVHGMVERNGCNLSKSCYSSINW